MTESTSAAPTASGPGTGLRARYSGWVEPAPTGLPRWRVVCALPVVLSFAFVLLVSLGITGSSTGAWWRFFGTGTDPDLLLGAPREIRSDEWLVQSSWVISQVQQGFPLFNHTFPGGMDASVQNDLPVWDWSALFRPHTLGFLVLPLDQGMAVRWWLPGLSLIAAAYLLLVTLMPRRPISAAVLAGCFFLSPLIQWWFLPTTIWPPTWAFLSMTAVIWAVRDPRPWVRILPAAGAGYLAVTMVMSIYVPFIVPAALVFGIVAVGVFVQACGRDRLGLRRAAVRLVPLVVAGVAAVAVIGLWVLTRRETITALLSTVYPGQRLEATGTVDGHGLVALFAGPFDESLTSGGTVILGPNASESATPLLAGLFLLVPLIYFVVLDWRRDRYLHWPMLAVIAGTALFLAFMLVPGWDFLAHLIFIDRSPATRARMGLAILDLLCVALLVRRLDRPGTRLPWAVSIVTAVLAAGSLVLVWLTLRSTSDPGLVNAEHWKVLAVLFVFATFAFTRQWVGVAAAALAVVALATGGVVNPVYRGVFDLTDTAVGQQIQDVNAPAPGSWVGIGDFAPTGLLVQSGVQAYNGVQTYPPALMWQQIDPTGQYEYQWNRLANVGWTPGVGAPVVQNPARDQIMVTFDSCSDFARDHVDYVLTTTPLDQACLRELRDITEGPTEFWIYGVDK